MTPERDDESGQFSEEYDREAFLVAVEELDNAATREVADRVGCSYDLAYRRLKELSDEGVIEEQKVGNSFLWKTTD